MPEPSRACALKGFDNFDVAECARCNAAVTAVPDLLTAPTAELALALALGLGRRTLEGDANVRAFRGGGPPSTAAASPARRSALWRRRRRPGGRGEAAGFAPAHVLYHDIAALAPGRSAPSGSRGATVASGLLARSDVLFVCTPLTAQTRHAICRETLENAAGAPLINVSRGSCVSEAAVADALEAGRLGGYATDVFEFEDWAWAGGRRREPRWAHGATLFSPHLGSAEETRREIEPAAAAEVVRWLDGEALAYRVN